MTIKVGICAAIVALALTSGASLADPDQNVSVMVEAAQQLSWDYENRAYLLVKQETTVAPVAVVFGYGDNAAACEELARALSQPTSMAGTFKCQPIY